MAAWPGLRMCCRAAPVAPGGESWLRRRASPRALVLFSLQNPPLIPHARIGRRHAQGFGRRSQSRCQTTRFGVRTHNGLIPNRLLFPCENGNGRASAAPRNLSANRVILPRQNFAGRRKASTHCVSPRKNLPRFPTASMVLSHSSRNGPPAPTERTAQPAPHTSLHPLVEIGQSCRRWFPKSIASRGYVHGRDLRSNQRQSCVDAGGDHQPHPGGRQAGRHPDECRRPDRHALPHRCLLRLSAGAGPLQPGPGGDAWPASALHRRAAHAASTRASPAWWPSRLLPVAVADVKNHPRFKYFKESGEEEYHSFLGVPLDRPRNSAGRPDRADQGAAHLPRGRDSHAGGCRRRGCAGGQRSAHPRPLHRPRAGAPMVARAQPLVELGPGLRLRYSAISIPRAGGSSTRTRFRC